MAWTTAVTDLRNLLSDNPNDRLRFRQRCFGEVNGVNRNFKTFEFRRVTDFTDAEFPLGVFINGEILSSSDISFDSPQTGIFTIGSASGDAPVDGELVEASFYVQWFLDAELDQFLQDAGNWAVSSSDYTALGGGLISAALDYAAHRAYQKMAQRWRDFISNTFKVEDQPRESGTSPTDEFVKLSESFLKSAEEKRKSFYSRQDRNEQPLFANVVGTVRNLP